MPELRLVFGSLVGLLASIAAIDARAMWAPRPVLAAVCFAGCAVILLGPLDAT